MKQALGVFASQLVYILLLGLQQLNVVGHNLVGAAVVSLLLGVLGFWLMSTIGKAKAASWRNLVWWAYVIAGPLGICLAMVLHGR